MEHPDVSTPEKDHLGNISRHGQQKVGPCKIHGYISYGFYHSPFAYMHVYYTMLALISVSLPDLYTKDATVLYLSRVLNLRAVGVVQTRVEISRKISREGEGGRGKV